ncbi:MAG: tripartite tricarboxylate transporter substrate-binding protein [Candidatus Marinimicrobia bacterium]|nr:tripartite tricarboxylate transporter substrate-binding protein [Candidatus Neomarinimicrobiota bacterium]
MGKSIGTYYLNRFFKNLLIAVVLISSFVQANFPNKPIKIVVYTGPGGLIDITARKFASVADKYVDATFVVENKPGAGGIVALKKVLQAPEDGYNLYACTKSNIAKFIQVGGRDYVDALHWTAMLMADPECVLTNVKNDICKWNDIVNNALQYPGKQNWVGPATGGLDHVTAMKIWDEYGMSAKWIPYKSGGRAIAALLGGQGVAYVGNPRDALGKPDLFIAAVSSDERLAAFPNAPTFAELGVTALNKEYMWRGFALKAGTPPDVIEWYTDLFQQVTADPDWKEFWEKGGIDVEFIGGDEFADIVKQDVETFEYYLTKSEIVSTSGKNGLSKYGEGTPLILLTIGLIIVMVLCGYFIYKSTFATTLGRIMVIEFFLIMSIIFYLQSFIFPVSSEVGPAVVPRLWIFTLVPLCILLLINTLRNKEGIEKAGTRIDIVLTFIGFLVIYLLMMHYIGYFLSTFIFLITGMIYLGYKNKKVMITTATIWIMFSYFIFFKILFVPLPIGKWFEMLF